MTAKKHESLGVDAHCAMLTDHIRDKSAQVMDEFKHFVQLYSAILGGGLAIRLQYGVVLTKPFAGLASGLVALVALISAVIILENWRSWFGFRRKLHAIAGKDSLGNPIVDPPSWKAAIVLSVLLLAMTVATLGFYCLNPLSR